MGYYMAGDYYLAGDPGLFSFLGKAAKGIAKTAIGVGGAALSLTPAGQAIQMVGRTLRGPGAFAPAFPIAPTFGAPTIPSPRAFAPTRMPTMAPPAMAPTAAAPGAPRLTKEGYVTTRKRPRMNPYNPRALARASRRLESMRKSMSKALRHTNYKIVSKGAGRGGGSRGVITRSEAARALRR